MRLLVIRVGAMGDVLHALPAIAALRQTDSSYCVGWAIESRWRALLEDSSGDRPLVQSIHDVETRAWKRSPLSRATLSSISGLRRALRDAEYDLCVDMQGSLRSAMIGRFAEANAFFGPAKPREAPARLLYRSPVPTIGSHVIEQGLALMSAATGHSLAFAPVALPVEREAEHWADGALEGAAGRPLVLLVPQAGWSAKQWPAERFGALAVALRNEGYCVVVNESGAGDDLAATVRQASGGAAIPLRSTLAQLIALTRRAALVVAGDTGPLHLAAALERPVVALFGPTDPARNGPFHTRARVLRHPESVTDHRRHRAPERGLLQISTDEVLQAARELLVQRTTATGALL